MRKKTDANLVERIEGLRRRVERQYDLQSLKREYQAGKKEALPVVVAVCLRDNLEVLEWARDDFCMAVLAGMGPWEKDFGHRGKDDGWIRRFNKRRRQIDMVGKDLFNWIEGQRKDNPVDPSLFEQAGKKFGVSAGTASNLYYSKDVRDAVAADRMISAVERLETDEIGPDADEEARTAWGFQNLDRIIEIERYHRAAILERHPRKSKGVISKKPLRKI